MSYIGEDQYFSYRDGKCELINKSIAPSSAVSYLGRKLAARFRRFTAGCCNFEKVHILYGLCCGIAESGKDVYVCENTELPSLLYSRPVLSADCAVYVSGDGGELTVSLFDKHSFPLSDSLLKELMELSPADISQKNGKMIPVSSFSSILANNISDCLGDKCSKIPAAISCGNKLLRTLWLEFFTGEDDKLAFQISDDGQRVNAYSQKYGFISHEKLRICYALKLLKNGDEVYLPEDHHYAADNLSKIKAIKRFKSDEVPPEAADLRFLTDNLFMCTQLSADINEFYTLLEEMPAFASSKREIAITNINRIPLGKCYTDKAGKIRISRSGKNRIALVAQSYSAEAAAELCCFWTEKLRKLDICGSME